MHFRAQYLGPSMALRKIVRFPSPFLRQPTKKVTAFDDKIRALVNDMMETMCDVGGAGLAAIQVGASERIFIIEAQIAGGSVQDPPRVFINPVLEDLSPQVDMQEEGCLSFPGIFVSVKRAHALKITAQDLTGASFTAEVSGFLARAIQHEYDHLENRLLYDHAGVVKRQMIKRKLDRMTDEEAMDILRNVGEEPTKN